MTTPVKIELAKLLEGKGFEQKERSSYLLVPFQECTSLDVFDHTSGSLGYGDKIGYYIPNKTVNAPTIADVVMWLYEKYGIWIGVEPPFHKKIVLWEYYIQKSEYRTLLGQNSGYDSLTEAYEAAIHYCLTNLI